MFGKILVFTHLGLSLILATWAMALYTTRVDWTDKKGTGNKPDGLMVERINEYNRLDKTVRRPVELKWQSAQELLVAHEGWRPIERDWYEKQLKFLHNGAVTEANPIRQVDRDANGTPVVVIDVKPGGDLLQMGPLKDKDGNPIKNRADQPLVLKSLDGYNKEYEATSAQLVEQLKRWQSAVDRDEKATRELKGVKPPRGLHAQIDLERVKQDRVRDEYEEVRPLMLKTAVELQNLEQLRQRLETRLRELRRSKGEDLK